MDKNCKKDEIMRYFNSNIRNLFDLLNEDFWNKLTSIRFTVNSPLIVEFKGLRTYIGPEGVTAKPKNAYIVTKVDIQSIFELITNSSIYAYSRYINEGYITLKGGNRVGISGNCVISDGKVNSISEISSLNFRISHEKVGVSDKVISYVFNGDKIRNTLVVSPPGCGKTTFLRDIARNLGSYQSFNKIIVCALVDERYEFGCSYDGYKNLDVGENNFLISGCPKDTGILNVTRSMAPDVVIVDEMCTESDFKAAKYAKNSGCSIIASVHGENELVNELSNVGYDNFFEVIIVLSSRNGPGTIEKIIGG